MNSNNSNNNDINNDINNDNNNNNNNMSDVDGQVIPGDDIVAKNTDRQHLCW